MGYIDRGLPCLSVAVVCVRRFCGNPWLAGFELGCEFVVVWFTAWGHVVWDDLLFLFAVGWALVVLEIVVCWLSVVSDKRKRWR